MPKVYVGNYYKSPIRVVSPPPEVHPRRFGQVFRNLRADCFSNNPYFVDQFPHESVMVVLNDGRIAPLDTHPDYPKWRNEMSSGELWALLRWEQM